MPLLAKVANFLSSMLTKPGASLVLHPGTPFTASVNKPTLPARMVVDCMLCLVLSTVHLSMGKQFYVYGVQSWARRCGSQSWRRKR